MRRLKPKKVMHHQYEKFRDFLKGEEESSIFLTYRKIENILGCESLCDSAYNHSVWWSGESHPLSKIWMEEGYKLKELALGKSIHLVKDDLSILKELGFQKIGHWSLEKKILHHNISGPILNEFETIFAFLLESQVVYLSTSSVPLKEEIYNYQYPDSKFKRKEEIHTRILESLKQGKDISIYCFNEKDHILFKGIKLDLISGLKKPLISLIDPEWN